MKSFKKLLAVVLSLAMVLGTLTVTALAGDVTEVSTFAALQTAVAAGGEIKLTADITDMSGSPAINVVKDVTIDLNGHKAIRAAGGNLLIIAAETTCTIKDTSASANGYLGFLSTKSTSNASPIQINGTLNLQSGGFKDIKSTSTSAIMFKIGDGAVFNMSGGFITGIVTTNRRVVQINQNGVFNFSGGEIYGNTVGTGADIFNYGGKVYISGNAMVNGVIDRAKANPLIEITGGWFSAQPTAAWIAEGYEWKADTTTKPGYAGQVQEKKAAVYVCEIGSKKYESITDAVAAAADGDTITMIADYAKDDKITTIPSGKSITLDLNGKALTNTFSGSTGTNARWFTVAGTLTLKDSVGTGSITANAGCTSTAAITFAQATGTVNIESGTYIEGSVSNQNCFSRATGGTYAVSGGWFTDASKPITDYHADGYSKVKVEDASKAATPFTVSNTTKTINYLKNGGSGTDVPADTYRYLKGYTTSLNVKSLSYTKAGFTCVGWSTDDKADPDGDNIIGSGEAVNFADETKYPDNPEHKVDLYAIYKEVDPTMWVCVDTQNPTIGYADVAAAFASSTDVTLIKNFNGRTTIEVTGDRRLNLNGYNIIANTAEDPTGSAIVVKTSGGALSIYNEDAGIEGFSFGGQGIVEGYAQGTGGAIDVIGSVGAILKIYGGTFTGDAPTHGTVLTNSGVGKTYIYGGTFIPANSESTVDALYANTGKIFVMAENQADVKIQGVMAKAPTGTIGIVGGYFKDLQPKATFGTYDPVNDRVDSDTTLSLVANTDDATYPYSVGATPWYITYNLDGGENDAENPAAVAKTDSSAITLKPATKTGYTFTGWTDADGNAVTSITGTELQADLTLTAQYEAITYTITYNNMRADGVAPEQTTFTVNDDVTLGIAMRKEYYLTKWTEGAESGGAEITGWKAGEKTENVNVWANWSTGQASVTVEDSTIAYATWDEVVTAAKAAPTATIKLLKNLSVKTRSDFRGGSLADLTIDLNGKNITKSEYTNSGLFIYEGTMTITGTGTVTDNSTNGATSANRSIMCQAKDAMLNIEGGTYVKFVKSTSNASKDNPGAGAEITGGKFSFDPSAEFKDDGEHIVTNNAEGETPATEWTIELAAASLIKSDGTKKAYEYVSSAIKATTNNSEVKLLKNASAAVEITLARTFTINLNGYKYQKAASGEDPAKTIEDLITPAAGFNIEFYYDGDIVTISVFVPAATITFADLSTRSYRYMKSNTLVASALDNVEDGCVLSLEQDAKASYEFDKEVTFTLNLNGHNYENTEGSTTKTITDLLTANSKYFTISIVETEAGSGIYTITVEKNDKLGADIISADGKTVTHYQYMKSDTFSKSALDNVKDNETIKLQKNSTATYEFDRAVSFKIDLNGYTYTGISTKLSATSDFDFAINETEAGSGIYNVTVTLKAGRYFNVVSVAGDVSDMLGLTVYVNTNYETIPTLTFHNGETTVPVEGKTDSTYPESNVAYKLTGIQIGYFAHDLQIKIKVNGETQEVDTYKSVQDYYVALMGLPGTTDAQKKLLSNTAAFADQIQKYKSDVYKDKVTLDAFTSITTNAPTIDNKAAIAKTEDGYKVSSATVTVGSRVSLAFIVKADATKVAAGNVVLKVTVGSNTADITITADMATATAGEYIVYMNKISPADYKTVYTAQIYVDGVANHGVTYSVNSYCYSMTHKDVLVANKDLATALYNFGTAFVACQ